MPQYYSIYMFTFMIGCEASILWTPSWTAFPLNCTFIATYTIWETVKYRAVPYCNPYSVPHAYEPSYVICCDRNWLYFQQFSWMQLWFENANLWRSSTVWSWGSNQCIFMFEGLTDWPMHAVEVDMMLMDLPTILFVHASEPTSLALNELSNPTLCF